MIMKFKLKKGDDVVVLTGKELNAILEKSYKEHMDSKNEGGIKK